jgi:predicted metal-dependent peptidase
MFVTNMTVEERLSRAVVAWMRREPSLSGVLMVGNRSVSNEIPTAATNGRDEWYNREFMDALNDAMVRFVVIHEVYHKMYRHPTTWAHLAKICSRTANIAMDYVINHKIMKAYGADGFVQMPENITYGDGQYFQKCFYDDKYEDWDTAKVFWDIYNASGGEGEGGPGPGSESPDGETGSGMCPNGGLFDEIDFDGAEELTREEKQELEREIDEALRQGALAAGKMGSGGNRDVDELLEPKINWREALRQWATATCAGTGISTWRKPNRRYLAGGYYMPSQISDALPSVHCSNDMSGSIGDVEAKIMVTETVNVCESVFPDTLHITYWDTEVCGYERYEREELDTVVDRTNPVGGGGTDPTVVPKYLKEHGIKPTASIVLTDGYIWGEWGDWDHPVLWVIIDNKNATPPCGSVIHVKREDFING